MKLAFSTLGCPEWTLEYALQQACDLGFQGLEIRGIQNQMRADTIDELCGEKREISLKNAREKGIVLCALDASASFHEKEKQEENTEEAIITVKKAAECGIPLVRIFGNNLPDADKDAQIKDIAGCVRRVCEAASPLGVQVLLEVHGDFNTSKRLLQTADAVGCENFGILWDIQHSNATQDCAEFWAETQELIRHVHIKDSKDGALCSVGQGTLPIERIVNMMTRDGYDGFFSLEWEKRWHPELQDAATEFPSYVAYMNKILQKG